MREEGGPSRVILWGLGLDELRLAAVVFCAKKEEGEGGLEVGLADLL